MPTQGGRVRHPRVTEKDFALCAPYSLPRHAILQTVGVLQNPPFQKRMPSIDENPGRVRIRRCSEGREVSDKSAYN